MASREIESLLDELSKQQGLPSGGVADIRSAIESSPYLASVMSQAIEGQTLRHIEISNKPNEGGHYDRSTGTIHISADAFKIERIRDRLDTLTGVLGHEAGHAMLAHKAAHTDNAYTFGAERTIKEAMTYGDPSVNVQPLADQFRRDYRQNEGFAELISMNAVASRVRTTGQGTFDLGSFLSRADRGTECIDGGKLDPRIRLDNNGIQFTGGKYDSPAVEAVAACHFDEGAKSLGLKGTSSYNDYYAANAVSVASHLWKDLASSTTQSMPLLEFNLSGMNVDKQRIEDAGLDLGGTGKAFNFIDRSHGGRMPISVTQAGAASNKQQPEEAPDRAPLLADNPSNPDFGTFDRIHQWVRGTGQWDEEKGRNVAAALYKEQVADPLVQRVDKVTGARGRDGAENVFAVYAPFGDKAPFFHAHVDGREVSQQPAQQNLEQAEQIKLQQAQELQMQQTLQQNNPAQQGPKLSL